MGKKQKQQKEANRRRKSRNLWRICGRRPQTLRAAGRGIPKAAGKFPYRTQTICNHFTAGRSGGIFVPVPLHKKYYKRPGYPARNQYALVVQ